MIAESKFQGETLNKSEELLPLLADSMHLLISYIDSEQRYRFNNKAYEKWFGCSRMEIYGKHVKDVMGEKAYQAILSFIEMALSGQEVTYESVVLNKGAERYVQATHVPHFGQQGGVQGFFALASDITERKQAESEIQKLTQQLQTAYAELKELHERRMDFTNMAAHELRTPLMPIIGYLNLLKKSVKGKKSLDYIEIMERNAERQRRLIDRMLEVSKLDAYKVELEHSVVDVNGLLRWLLDDYAPAGRKFDVDVPGSIIIIADRGKLFQILDVLISNAIKYSKGDTEVKIVVRGREEDYMFKIIDRGIGIAKEDHKRIFERFYLVNGNKSTRSCNRTGLGLTLARGYVELHGGKIWVESEPNKGSTFCFTIPKSRAIQEGR